MLLLTRSPAFDADGLVLLLGSIAACCCVCWAGLSVGEVSCEGYCFWLFDLTEWNVWFIEFPMVGLFDSPWEAASWLCSSFWTTLLLATCF